MSAFNFNELRAHIGHDINVVCFGVEGEEPHNVAVECATCNEILFDYDNPIDSEEDED